MDKDSQGVFIYELRLKTSPYEMGVLNKRLDMARKIYNACLGEALKRLRLMRESKQYQAASKLSNKERSQGFKAVRKQYAFSEYDLHAFVKTLRKDSFLEQHIDSSTAQKLASRAFNSVVQYAVGKRGKPRFKSVHRFSSVEGKSNVVGIRWKDGKIVWGKEFSCAVISDVKDKHGVEYHALSKETKYVRLVRRKIKGKQVWYAQLIQLGRPHQKLKNQLGNDIVGLDIGPSSIAVVGEHTAHLQAFCPEIEDVSRDIKRLQRQMSRMMRLNNPENFEPDRMILNKNGNKILKKGKVKKGVRKWFRSLRYLALKNEVAELQRKMAAQRKSSHGQLANNILAIGVEIKTENLSYKRLQKNFGKSVGKRAPGLFIERLRYKAENAGGQVIEFNTRTTALSQTCQCGQKQKKALKERWHCCGVCGIEVQRDLYSAYLARFVNENQLDRSQAIAAWPGAEILLEQALSNLEETVNGKNRLASFGLNLRPNCLFAKEGSVINKALDDVAIA
ncbi:MAG: transposase [Gammaproteobacteria bacterium]|nr:transposase [Gammaproteobacteria bacterium]